MSRKVIAIIPARYASTRFPAKPLAKLGGKSIISRVVKKALESVDRAIVATDDIRIYDEVVSNGYEAIMTSQQHNSGTERIIEALENIDSSNIDIVINLQGDEPFIRKEQIDSLISLFDNKDTDIATLVQAFDENTSNEELFDPSKVKAVISHTNKALYFSRFAIPYQRGIDANWAKNHKYYKHIGIYAFRTNILKQIKDLPKSQLEDIEKLEQLRWLESGLSIYCGETKFPTIGIDTPEDLIIAEKYLKENDR